MWTECSRLNLLAATQRSAVNESANLTECHAFVYVSTLVVSSSILILDNIMPALSTEFPFRHLLCFPLIPRLYFYNPAVLFDSVPSA
jgi:hypothetical protein